MWQWWVMGVVVVEEGGGGRESERVGMARRKSNGRKELLACCKRNRFQSLLGRNRGSSSHVHVSSGTCTLRWCFTRESPTALSSVSRSSSSHAQAPENNNIALLLSQLEASPIVYSDTTATSLCSREPFDCPGQPPHSNTVHATGALLCSKRLRCYCSLPCRVWACTHSAQLETTLQRSQ